MVSRPSRRQLLFALNITLFTLAFLSIPVIVEYFAIQYPAITIWHVNGGVWEIYKRFISTDVATCAATVTFALGMIVGTMSSFLILMSREAQ